MLIHVRDRLQSGGLEEYDRAHRELPPDVLRAIRGAAVSEWTIWRDGVELHQLVRCDGWDTFAALDDATPSHWRARMSRLVDPSHATSAIEVVEAWSYRPPDSKW